MAVKSFIVQALNLPGKYKTSLRITGEKRSSLFRYVGDEREERFCDNSVRPDQLQEIRKTSLARVICDNLDNVDSVQVQIL
jgi:hypothetical protein